MLGLWNLQYCMCRWRSWRSWGKIRRRLGLFGSGMDIGGYMGNERGRKKDRDRYRGRLLEWLGWKDIGFSL